MQVQSCSCKNAAVAAPKAGEGSEGAGVVLREVIKKGIFYAQAGRKRPPPLMVAFCEFFCVFFLRL